MLAFAAERRRLLHGARSYRSISPVRTALSSKPAPLLLSSRSIGQTDRQTDGRTDNRYIETCSAFSAGGVKYTKEYGAEYE